MIKKAIAILLCLMFVVYLVGCKSTGDSETSGQIENQEDAVNLDLLEEKYPEYFELSESKGVEIYVWQMAEDSYRCGMISETGAEKRDEQILELQFKSLSINEAMAIIEEVGISKDRITVYPITQPFSSYSYEIDEEYTEKVKQLFE